MGPWRSPTTPIVAGGPAGVGSPDGGWSAHPDAVEGRVERPGVAGARRSVAGAPRSGPSARVVGFGAVCDLRPPAADGARSQSFSVAEFALLEDGRRVILHEDRGFTLGPPRGAGPHHLTAEDIARDVLNVVLPDDDECRDAHPWAWLTELALARGLDVTADDLRRVPYEVVLTDRLTRWLASS